MAIIAMVIGQSGTGKSTSLRNFTEDEAAVINVSGKPLPFRNKLKTIVTDDYAKIKNALEKAPAKTIVIDDATYLMTDEFMRTAKVTGYQKFTDMALGNLRRRFPKIKPFISSVIRNNPKTEEKNLKPSAECLMRR